MQQNICLNINKKPQDTLVVVAMSGGVDSSVVAASLKKSGYNVIGITMKLYGSNNNLPKQGACCGGDDVEDARLVAEKFNFPHYVLNYESIFTNKVIDDFADSYLRGETPIPCVRCNQTVKFNDLMKMAKDLKADALVTGHYIKKVIDKNGNPQLHRAIDKGKDQSYFLFATTKEQLNYCDFPLGNFNKTQTREMAKNLGLKIFDKPDSQDICFVPKKNYSTIVEQLRPNSSKKGDIITIDGNIIGQHNGIINYTIGQRKGIGISHKEALFVIKIDAKNNRIIVGEEKYLYKKKFTIQDVNWLGKSDQVTKKFALKVKLRSSQKPQKAFVKINNFNNSGEITMAEPIKSITPGQACVFYQNEQMLGGGWITNNIS